jgi:tRNA (adenine22-N1)-methyltransferase
MDRVGRLMLKLSKRLETIAQQVPAGSRLADIGSDHAQLPVYLVQQGIVHYAVAGEINPGPFEAASKQVREAALEEQIKVRQGDGLQAVEIGEVDTITIAGMGGALIVHILEQGKAKLAGVYTLVLQPNVGEDQVRHWLVENGWRLITEQILQEDGKIYEVLTANKPTSDQMQVNTEKLYNERVLPCGITVSSELLYRMGPYLLEQPNAVFYEKWRSELQKLASVSKEMARSDLDSAKIRRAALLEETAKIEEVLACLQKGKP